MCYQVERVKNCKLATLQMAKGQYFHMDPTNKCFAIQPFTRTDTCIFPSSAKDVTFLSGTSTNQLQCLTTLHTTPPLCHKRNSAKQASTQAHIALLERPNTLNMQAIDRSHNKPNTSQEGKMGFACMCLSRWSLPTLPPMCYQAERVKNRKPTTLQMTKGQCFHMDPTNKCFTIQPFTRTDTCIFPSSVKDVTFLSTTSANQLATVFDNPAYYATIMPQQPKQHQTCINTSTYSSPRVAIHCRRYKPCRGVTTNPTHPK